MHCMCRGSHPTPAILVLRFSAAPKGPKQESPGGGNPACGVGPGDPIRMKIHPALKGRNKILDHKPVLPLQGVAILNTRSDSQGGALGWHVAAPSGRDSRSATSKEETKGSGAESGAVTRILVNHEGGRGRVPLGNLHNDRVSRRNPSRGKMGPRVVG